MVSVYIAIRRAYFGVNSRGVISCEKTSAGVRGGGHPGALIELPDLLHRPGSLSLANRCAEVLNRFHLIYCSVATAPIRGTFEEVGYL